jgi:hypothetical protein
MKTPVALVTAGLTLAILLAASLLIVTGTRGQDELAPLAGVPMDQTPLTSPAAK